MNAQCLTLQSSRGVDFSKTLYIPFSFSPSLLFRLPNCYSTPLDAGCKVYLTKNRGNEGVSFDYFYNSFFFFLMERMVLPLEFISRCFFGLASVRLWRGVRLEAIREGLGNNTEMLIAMKTADTYLAWSISK